MGGLEDIRSIVRIATCVWLAFVVGGGGTPSRCLLDVFSALGRALEVGKRRERRANSELQGIRSNSFLILHNESSHQRVFTHFSSHRCLFAARSCPSRERAG